MQGDDQPARILVRQGPQQDRVDDREDRGRGADSECQREHRQNREAGLAGEKPEAVAQVASERMHVHSTVERAAQLAVTP